MRYVIRFVVGISLVAACPSLRAQPGQSGMAFLKLGVTGRGIAMGDAMGADVTGSAATYYNPAGLLGPAGEPSSSQLVFMHREWIQDTRTEFLGSSIPLGEENAFGLALNSTTVSDIELRTRPGPADGTFSARQLSFGLSFSHRLGDDLRLGATGKFLYQKILTDEESGFAADLGAQWRTPLQNLTIGAAFSNLGSMSGILGEKTVLPSLMRLGPAYSIDLPSDQLHATVAADFLRIFPETRNYLDTGAEIVFNHLVAARAGYEFGSEGRGLSLGVGIQYGVILLDYAFSKLSADLGDTHTISLALNI
ncbi:MAG TPA: PorV/PorQ family protein [Bacteroidota bacterium]|nr:PorV/PorQ family protein [Bacteroidota bacterium]